MGFPILWTCSEFQPRLGKVSQVHRSIHPSTPQTVDTVSTDPGYCQDCEPLENKSRFLEYVSVDCFSLASHASTHHRKSQMFAVFDIGLLIAAVTVDFVSLVLNARRAFRGHGASGVPGISWIVYVVLLEWRNEQFFFKSAGQAGVVLTSFHILCHVGVPWTIELLFRGKRRTPKS